MTVKTAERILAALCVPVLLLDESLRAVLANPAFHKTLKVAPARLKGKPIQEIVTEASDEPQLTEILRAVVTSNTSVEDVEIACRVSPRTQKFLAVSARLLPISESLTRLVLLELRDITYEKEADLRIHELNVALLRHGVDLEEINKELEAFAQTVSHDLRTPLRLTNKLAHLLLEEEEAQLSAGAMQKARMIVDSTRQMGQLIEDLLAFSRVGREPIKKRLIDMRRLAREALAELLEARQGRETRVLIDQLPQCRGDRALLKQVFLNLLANALKFSEPREQAEIHVGFTETNGENVYFVRDNGMGFDMAQSETIFLAFRRLERARDVEGSGLGLALVRRIVERHGGRVWAESAKDCGSTFFFTLSECLSGDESLAARRSYS